MKYNTNLLLILFTFIFTIFSPAVFCVRTSASPSDNSTLPDSIKLEIHKQVEAEVEDSRVLTINLINFLIAVLAATPIAIAIFGFMLKGGIIQELVRIAQEQARQQIKEAIESELQANIKTEFEKQAQDSLADFRSQLIQYESEARRDHKVLTEEMTNALKRIQSIVASDKDPTLYAEIKKIISSLQSGQKPAGVSNYSECHTLGMMAHMSGNYDIAINFFDRAIEIDPKESKAWTSKGDSLYRIGEYSKALEAYTEAIVRGQDDYEAWTYKGNALVALKEYNKAINAFNQSIRINAKFPYSWYYLARCYAANNQLENALKSLNTAITLNPICREMASKDHKFERIRQNQEFLKLLNFG